MRLDGFEDFQEIGRGGFSTVYRAHQLRPDRIVAIKVLDVGVRGRNERAAFEREGNLSARLGDHPHALPVYEVGFDRDGHPFIVLPFCEGGSLNDQLGQGEDLDVSEAVQHVVKVGAALSAAHALGILHRDVKPANILLDAYGEPRLADFGLARLAEQTEGEQSLVMYTPLYAAPEQRLDEPVDEHTDQYGLAVTLFALLEGRPPQPEGAGGNGAVRLHRILTDGPPSVRRPDVPMALREVVRRGMATSPADRFDSVEEFSRAVSRAVGTPALAYLPRPPDGEQTIVRNPEPPSSEPASRRHWWPVAVGATVSLALIAGAVLFTRGEAPGPAPGNGGTSTTVSPTTTLPPRVELGPEFVPRNPKLSTTPDGTVIFEWMPPSAVVQGETSAGLAYFSTGGTAPLEPLPRMMSNSWVGRPPADAGCFYAVAIYDKMDERERQIVVPSKPAPYRGAACADVEPFLRPAPPRRKDTP